MSKSPRFNWRVFCYLRQRQVMLVGAIFLALLLSSSLVYSVLEGSDTLEGIHHQQEKQEQLMMEDLEQQLRPTYDEDELENGGRASKSADTTVDDWVSSPEEHDSEEAGSLAQETGSRAKNRRSYAADAVKATLETLDKDPVKAQRNNRDRQEAVHAAILHSWGAYKQFAWGADELLPDTREGQKWFGLGLTLIDTLDLLWLTGEKEEFDLATKWVEQDLDCSAAVDVNVFEVTIRVMGGLLSAYHYSQKDVFLVKAKELGANLKNAFLTKSGVPYSDANLARKQAFAPMGAPDSSTSEATSIQMEFKYLAYLTDDHDLYHLADLSMHAIEGARRALPADMRALPPMYINADSGKFVLGSTITLGARGDSYYEYLLKQWLLTGKKETQYLNKYLEAVNAIRDKLLAYSHPHGLAFIGELISGKRFSPKMDHLVCFLPGTLALGYLHGADESHLELAKELMATCYELYNSTVTGLSPEIAYFNMGDEENAGAYDILIQPRDAHNILRPETVESLFYLHKATTAAAAAAGNTGSSSNSVYQEWGWKIFNAFERYSKVATGGYSGLQNVQDPESPRINKMESFWLGETLKYFYLLFSDQDLVPLDRYVFNTEAHPFPIFLPPWDEEQDLHDKEEWEEEEEEERQATAEERLLHARAVAATNRRLQEAP